MINVTLSQRNQLRGHERQTKTKARLPCAGRRLPTLPGCQHAPWHGFGHGSQHSAPLQAGVTVLALLHGLNISVNSHTTELLRNGATESMGKDTIHSPTAVRAVAAAVLTALAGERETGREAGRAAPPPGLRKPSAPRCHGRHSSGSSQERHFDTTGREFLLRGALGAAHGEGSA